MLKVVENIKDLKSFVDKTVPSKEYLQQQQQSNIDIRVAHVVAIEGRRPKDRVTMFDQLCRGLAKCSLASDYQNWLDKHTGESAPRRGKHIKGTGSWPIYLKDNEDRFRRNHLSTLAYTVRCGKLLLTYKRELKGSGYLAVIFFWPTPFQAAENYEMLVYALLNNSAVKEFAEHSRNWVDQ